MYKRQARGVADEIVKRSVDTMLECIGPDLWEEALLRPMDFGHSFSRTLETDNTFFLRHGEAVAIDMAFSCVLSYVRGDLDEPSLTAALTMLSDLGLPTWHPRFDAKMVDTALYERVKFSSGQKIPLPTGRGVARIHNDITDEQVAEALVEWKARCA